MWERAWQSSRVPVDRAGPLAWTPSLDGPRLTGRHLPSPAAPPGRARAMTRRSFPRPTGSCTAHGS